MNNLIVSNNQATMSSREIADLLQVRHDNVKLSIERLTEKQIVSFTSATETSHEGAGARPMIVYMVNKRDSYVIVAQMQPQFTAKLVDRWQELEAKQSIALPDFNNPVIAARAWADAKESEQKALVALEGAKPAIEFVERYTQSTGDKGFRSVCKLLKANENKFREFLLNEKILYPLDGNLTPYGNHIDAGRFAISTGISDSEHAYTTSKFTPKGINWIAGLWAVYNLKV